MSVSGVLCKSDKSSQSLGDSQGLTTGGVSSQLSKLALGNLPQLPNGDKEKSSPEYETYPLLIEAPGAKWTTCPSDHLPVGVAIQGTSSIEKIYCVSWNVLDPLHVQQWMIEQNSQGLKGSVITTTQKISPEDGILISEREKTITELICDMITHKTCEKSFVALQECGEDFLKYLPKKLPERWKLLESRTYSGCAVIYDSEKMKIQQMSEEKISQEKSRAVMDITFLCKKEGGKKIRVLNVHVTGDPQSSYKKDLMQYVNTVIGSGPESLIVCGDMNFTVEEMQQELTETEQGRLQFCVPYRSNIGPMHGQEDRYAKAIDFFITRKREVVRPLSATEIFSGKNVEVITQPLQLFMELGNTSS